MSNCLNCQKAVQNTEGKRPKKFCSDKCRATYHNKNKAKESKYIQLKTHEGIVQDLRARIKLLEAQISAQSKPDDTKYQNNLKDAHKWTRQPSGSKIQNFTNDQNTNKVVTVSEKQEDLDKETILERIKELEADLKNPAKNTMIGQKAWIALRENELKKLKAELNQQP